ncbi:unnamed protein product [Closterium sp. Naga37s-1]|nr:unnamed protein product [Closterium sp. Naga37s-1]
MRKARAVVAVDVVPSLAAVAAPDGPQPERPPLLPVASPAAHVPLPDSDAAHAARPDRHRAGMNGVTGEEGGRRGKGAGAMGLRVLEEVEGDAGDSDVRAVAFDSPPPLSDSSPGSGRSMRHLGSSRSMTISRGPSMTEEEDDEGDDDGLLSVRRGGAAPPLSLWDDDDSRLDSSRSNATPGSGRSFRSSSSSGGGASGGGRAPKKHTGVGPALQQRPLPQSMSMNRARMRLAGMKLDLRVLPSGPAGVLLPEQSAAQHLSAQGDAAAGPDGFSVTGDGGRFGGEGGGGEEEEEEESGEAMQVRDRKEKFVFFEKQCSCVLPHVYVGSDAVARDRGILRQSGITHVVNCVGFVCPEYFPHDITYKTLWLQDNTSEDIQCVLYDVFDFVNEVKQVNGRVFVHCCQGVSRSTSLVIAYLMWAQQVEFEDAFRVVKDIRGVASPNMGFACQLLQWQKRVLSPPPPSSPLLPAASPRALAVAAADGTGAGGSADSSRCNGESAGQGGQGKRQMENVRVYRMAPHSPYDPLHLVPKMLTDVSVSALDPRGAFIVQRTLRCSSPCVPFSFSVFLLPRSTVASPKPASHPVALTACTPLTMPPLSPPLFPPPSLQLRAYAQVGAALYVWQGAECRPPMQQQAQHAAAQIVRYERLPAAASLIHQGQEPHGFKAALSSQRLVRGGSGEWGVCLSVLEREGLTYLGQDAHHLPGHGALHSDPASMLPVLVAGGRGAGGASGRGVGDGGSEGGSRRGEWVVEEREEYSFDFECFNKGLDGGTPQGAGAMSAPPTKVLPHQHRGWLEATLPLNPAYSLPWESPNATPRGAQPSPALQTPAAAAAAGSGVGSAVASTSSALARLTVHDEDVDAGSKAGEAREARGGEEGTAPRKPVFAPLPLHAHTSMPSPSSFSPRSLGFFPPSGSGAYGAALSKFSKPAAAVRDPHRLKDQSGGSKVVVEGATGNGAGNGGGSGLRAGGLQVSELGSSGGGVRRGLPPLTPRTKGGMRAQQDKGWGETGQAGAEADTGGEEGGLMPGDELQAITEVDDPGLQRDYNEGAGHGDADMGAGVGPVWLPSPRRGKPKLRAAWEEGEGDEAGEEEERGGRSEVGVVQGKEDEGKAAVLGALPQRRGRAVRGFQSTGSEAGAVDTRGKAPKLPPRPALPPSAPCADSSSSSATNSGAALPPAPRFSSLSKGRGDGGEGWGESGEGEVDKAESSGMDAFGVPLTPRRRLPPRSAFGRGFKGDDGDQAGDGGMRSKRQGVSRKEKDWPPSGDDYGVEGGVASEEGDDMEVEDGTGAGMALPTPRRLGPQIKKIF